MGFKINQLKVEDSLGNITEMTFFILKIDFLLHNFFGSFLKG